MAFQHHAWATRNLLDMCAALSQEQQTRPAPGVYGTVLDTLRHLVGADRWYLVGLVDGSGRFENRPEALVEDGASVEEVIRVADQNALAWERLVPTLDLATEVETSRLEGGTRRASVDLRLAQVLHHGNEHRGQVCTVLTTLGVEPPPISVWEYGLRKGLVTLFT